MTRGMDSRMSRATRVYTVIVAALTGAGHELTRTQKDAIRALLDRPENVELEKFPRAQVHQIGFIQGEFVVGRKHHRHVAAFPSLKAALEAFPGAIVTRDAERAARAMATDTAGRPEPELDYYGGAKERP